MPRQPMTRGREDTGWRSAALCTILDCCRNHGVEPYASLRNVLEILPRATNWQIPSLPLAARAAGEHLPVLHVGA